jgi:hypothetical protein
VFRQLWSSIYVNFIFYRRNRLLLVIVLLLGFVFLTSLIPSLLFETSTQRFGIVKTIFEFLNYFLFLFAAALGLLSASTHLRDRSIKMVATKPLPTELWLLSHFISAGLVFLVLATAAFFLGCGMLAVWEIPFQGGLVYHSIGSICSCMVLFSYLTFLSLLVHPAIAGLIVLILQEQMFYQLSLLAASGQHLVDSSFYGAALGGIQKFLYFVYTVLPVFSPFPDAVARIEASYRMESGDGLYLLGTVAYATVLALLMYLLSLSVLRRRRLV